jgi:hypothetical protein
LTVRLETANFRVSTDSVPEATLRAIADRLESERPRILRDLSVATTRRMDVKVWADRTAWSAEVQRYFGRAFETSGYVTGPDELRVLLVPNVEVNAVHEMTHCVSLYVDPTFGNNPRWLWETVAVYEAGQRVDPRSLEYMASGRPPTLQELNVDVTVGQRVYEVGYLLGEFIVARGGQAGLLALIRAHGDTGSVLGLSAREFEQAWYAYVRANYLG